MSSTTSSLKTEQTAHRAESCESDLLDQGGTSSSPAISTILDMPDEVLREIISHLNVRERLPLSHSCRRFNNLVLRDAQCLSHLDFSIKAHLTSLKTIQEYFADENSCRYIKKLNLRNVVCLNPGSVLISSVSKALNLVDLNIHGIIFKDIWELAYLLNPLIYLQRLSIEWPEVKESQIPLCSWVLEHPFSRLVYLSVEMSLPLLKVFISSLRLCHELKELRMEVKETSAYDDNYDDGYDEVWCGKTNKELRNLKIVEYCGPYVVEIKELFVTMFTNREKWTDFQLNRILYTKGFHIEKNVEICEEMLACRWTDGIPNPAWNSFDLEWTLFPECLLKEILITQRNIQEDLCCLSTFMHGNRCLLTIKDAKALLKNPRHQISFLFINHVININCDVHMIASAFPNITELIISCAITRDIDTPVIGANLQCREIIQIDAVSGKPCKLRDLRTSFQLLVKNTPHLRHLTLNGFTGQENWDFDELHHISSWKSLQTLRLVGLPIKDGNFLIEIGKQCKNLRKLELIRLGSSILCYAGQLFQMLKHCENLRDFSIVADKIEQGSVMFAALLASSTLLRRVHLRTLEINYSSLISFIERLLKRCSMLITFTCYVYREKGFQDNFDMSPIHRLKIERGPDFEIGVYYSNQKSGTNDIKEDTPRRDPFF